ncbi:hypothetical protein IMG5_181210, partial [Ichthyophthirius multifiliis]
QKQNKKGKIKMSLSNLAQFGQMGLNQNYSQYQNSPIKDFSQVNQFPYFPVQILMVPYQVQPTMINSSFMSHPQPTVLQIIPYQQDQSQNQAKQQYQNEQNISQNNIMNQYQESPKIIKKKLSFQNQLNFEGKPSQNFLETQNQNQKWQQQQEYQNILKTQQEIKKFKNEQLKEQEKLELEKLMQEKLIQQLYNKAAIQRDSNGNILTTKIRPGNRNFQSMDWFSGNQQYPNNMETTKNIFYKHSSIPDLEIINQDIKQKRDLEKKIQVERQQFQSQSNIDDIHQNSNHIRQSYDSRQDLEKLKKAEQAIQLQKDILELRKIQDIRDGQLEDLRIQRERLDNEQQLQIQQKQLKINIDQSKQYSEQQNNDEKQEKMQYEQKQDLEKIKQKILGEIPQEISKIVKQTINGEIQSIRYEINFHKNNIEEQIQQIKSQIDKANEKKEQTDINLNSLNEQLSKQNINNLQKNSYTYESFIKMQKSNIYASKDIFLLPKQKYKIENEQPLKQKSELIENKKCVIKKKEQPDFIETKPYRVSQVLEIPGTFIQDKDDIDAYKKYLVKNKKRLNRMEKIELVKEQQQKYEQINQFFAKSTTQSDSDDDLKLPTKDSHQKQIRYNSVNIQKDNLQNNCQIQQQNEQQFSLEKIRKKSSQTSFKKELKQFIQLPQLVQKNSPQFQQNSIQIQQQQIQQNNPINSIQIQQQPKQIQQNQFRNSIQIQQELKLSQQIQTNNNIEVQEQQETKLSEPKNSILIEQSQENRQSQQIQHKKSQQFSQISQQNNKLTIQNELRNSQQLKYNQLNNSQQVQIEKSIQLNIINENKNNIYQSKIERNSQISQQNNLNIQNQ